LTNPELDIERFGSSLDWRQFEGLVELAFKSFGYSTYKNFRTKRPRAEVDLLAIAGNHAFAVDCKHWKRTVGLSTMSQVADRQISRCRSLLRTKNLDTVTPVILTLHDEQLLVLDNGVPIVPIHKVSDFLLNWDNSSTPIKSICRSDLD
jgi:hypothetical protein